MPATSAPAGTTPATAPPTTAATAAACTTSDLSLSLGSAQGTAGAVYYTLVFHDSSSSACSLYGYPGVSFLDASGAQIGDPAAREPNETVDTVTIHPGGDGYVELRVTDPGIPPCSSTTSPASARVYPPGSTTAVLVPAPAGLEFCGSPNTANYTSASVTPVDSTPV
jgi:hypothetical protein